MVPVSLVAPQGIHENYGVGTKGFGDVGAGGTSSAQPQARELPPCARINPDTLLPDQAFLLNRDLKAMP